ncbi:MAG: globin [Burkholderiales bacterium]
MTADPGAEMPQAERARWVQESLELLAERVGDPSDRVYERLFEILPQTRALFIRDTAGIVRHEMLARAFETILDLVDEGRVAHGLLLSEYVNHQQIGVPTGAFEVFFDALVQVIREVLSDQWTALHEQAWASVLADIRTIVARGHGGVSLG